MNDIRRSIHLRPALAASALAFVPRAMAAAAVATPQSAACSAAEFHQLDYWIGDWDSFESQAPGGASVARARRRHRRGLRAPRALRALRAERWAHRRQHPELRPGAEAVAADLGHQSRLDHGPRRHRQGRRDGARRRRASERRQDGQAAHHVGAQGRRRARVRRAVQGRRQDLGTGVRRVVPRRVETAQWKEGHRMVAQRSGRDRLPGVVTRSRRSISERTRRT